jgi:hypothetical protein
MSTFTGGSGNGGGAAVQVQTIGGVGAGQGGLGQAQRDVGGVVEYTTAGAHTFVFPALARYAVVELYGNGGGGGHGSSGAANGSGGGGGGGYAKVRFLDGADLTITITNAGGVAQPDGDGQTAGTNTVVRGGDTVSISGGGGGIAGGGAVGAGGAGGVVTLSSEAQGHERRRGAIGRCDQRRRGRSCGRATGRVGGGRRCRAWWERCERCSAGRRRCRERRAGRRGRVRRSREVCRYLVSVTTGPGGGGERFPPYQTSPRAEIVAYTQS